MSLIGNKPNQLPRNADLGMLAYQDYAFDSSAATSGQVLVSQGAGKQPVFQSLPAGIGKWQSFTSSSSFTAPRDGYFRFYVFGAGGNASAVTNASSTGGGGGGCAYGDIEMTKGQVATITISGGVATVTVGGVVMLTANNASGTVAGTATKHASVLNGGNYSGGTGTTVNATQASAVGATCGSPLGVGKNGGSTASNGSAGRGCVADGGYGASGNSKKGRDFLNGFSDPLLYTCTSPAASAGDTNSVSAAGDGAGGSNDSSGVSHGGFMGGGGLNGGDGGFGASGGSNPNIGVGSSGYGAGGSANNTSSSTQAATGGAAICLVYY